VAEGLLGRTGGAIMSSHHEEFWNHASYAFVAHSAVKPFPKLSYGELKKQGRKVFAVDPSADRIEGDAAFPDLDSLPEKVEAVVLETPREETAEWVRKAADAGVRSVWIHMGRETPEAVALAKERGLEVLTGTCAVMYVKPGLSYHSLHKWINQLIGRY
jgi:predicted CoA-binding protein